MNSQLLILGLHRVGVPPANAKIRGLFISPKLLAFQLSLVRKMGFRFTTLEQALANPQGRRAVITFDDGYADNLTHALPVLQSFNAPATVFVITGDVGKKAVVWSEAGEDLPADILDWDSLAHLQKQGWEIGSHADRHIHLARYTEAEQENSIFNSLVEIERNLGAAPVSFAYPYGSYNDTTKRVVERLGIKYAVTTNETRWDEKPEDLDLLELSRCSLGGRKLHHYAKSVARTSKAVGQSEIWKSLLKSRRINDQSTVSLPILKSADHDVMS